jgi:hypothetical protein
MSEFSRTDPGRFSAPAIWDVRIPIGSHGPQHNGILANFVAAILDSAPLIAPGEEGIRSLELANAFLLSTFEDRSVQLPVDGALFEQHLRRLIASSTREKPEVSWAISDDMANSFR